MIKRVQFYLLRSITLATVFGTFLQVGLSQTYPTQPYYNQQNNLNADETNYSAKSPFKLEVAKLEATVLRPGEEPLPLSQVPRLNQGDVLKVKIANEPVNGIMPHQSNWDWTLLVAFINPSRNNSSNETVTEEIRLKNSGWYNDNFFTVPFDSQPMIFIYPKPNQRKKILDLLAKKPDEIRQMGERILEISSAYGHISSFLTQVQFMMSRPGYNNGLLEQSIEGMARTFNIQMPNCWRNSGYGYGGYGGGYGGYNDYGSGSYSSGNNLAERAQCLSRNIRIDDLNFSVGRMIQQGGLMALAQLRDKHPAISKWIALVAVAVDFILKLTRKTALRIIPAVVSTPDNPIFTEGGFYGAQYTNNNAQYYARNNYNANGNYNTGATRGNQLATPDISGSSKVSLFANYQPSDREFLTVFAYVPHKWQAEPDPKITNLYAPQLTTPCMFAGKNMLRNMDMRIEWLSDTFTRDFKLILNDDNGWKKEFPLRKNSGLNSWEVDISKEDIIALPPNNVFEGKITGKRGFTEVESPTFQVPISNGGKWEASIEPGSKGRNIVTLKKISGDARCTQNIVYKTVADQPVMFPLSRDNNLIRMSEDMGEIAFEVDASETQGGESIQMQMYGGEIINVTVKP